MEKKCYCKALLVAGTILMSACLQAQKHNYIWLYGYENTSTDSLLGGGAVDFNYDPPRLYPQKRKVDLSTYTAVCSDSSGRMLFYTNGISIRDTTHEIMLFGDTINPGKFWNSWHTRSYPMGPFCFPLPAPGKSNHYYLFHVGLYTDEIDGGLFASPFYCTLIDMNGNAGRGKVIKKNRPLINAGSHVVQPVSIKHGNGRDWWIITGDIDTKNILVFLLDPDGIHGPFKYQMAAEFPGVERHGMCAVSPDGRTYVRCDFQNGLHILDFNRCTGTFSNLRLLPFGDGLHVIASMFAPDSHHLFLSNQETVMSLDIASSNPAATLDTLAYFDGFAAPFNPFRTWFYIPGMGPDGRIYYATTNSTLAMHIVHRPNWPGQSADVEQHGLTLPKLNDGSMPVYPNYRLGEFEGAPCDTLNRQAPDNGFEKSYFEAQDSRSVGGFTTLPAIGPQSSPQRKPSGEYWPDFLGGPLTSFPRAHYRYMSKTATDKQ